MKKLFLIKFILLLVLFSGCQTINEKSEEIAKKENEKLSKFIGQPESELKIVMGNPDEETKDEKGSKILIYQTEKNLEEYKDKLINRLFGFELLMASYAMAHLKMDMVLSDEKYQPKSKLNIYLTN